MRAQTTEDLTRQREVLQQTAADVRGALERIATEAKLAARLMSVVTPSLDDVYAAVAELRRAEEAHDLARLDLHTAAGGDA